MHFAASECAGIIPRTKKVEKLGAMWHDGEMRDRLEFAINKKEYVPPK